jgi:hypothetical protein
MDVGISENASCNFNVVPPPPPPLTTVPTIDGRCLVLSSGSVLPDVCVKTNQPISAEDQVTRTFYWCSPLVALWFLVSGLLVMLVYFIARKKCELTFGLSPSIKKKYRNRLLFKILAAIALFFAMPVSATVNSAAVPIIVMILFIAAIVSLFVANSPLSVARYEKGRFWVKGFSDEYLAAFATSSRAIDDGRQGREA